MPIITIPTPCHENWQQMTPAAQGRHCAACQTVIVDFTRFTDTELLAYLGQPNKPATCGRFRAGQLNRPLRPVEAATAVSRWRMWLAAAVAVWGLREAATPAVRAQVPVEQREPDISTISLTMGLVAEPPVVLRGTVLDSVSREPLPGVTILLTGTQIGVSSAANGQFELVVPTTTWAASSKQLTVSSIGYVAQHVSFVDSSAPLLTVTLAPDTGVLTGELIVTGDYAYRPWYTPRGLWQRVKRPFQRW